MGRFFQTGTVRAEEEILAVCQAASGPRAAVLGTGWASGKGRWEKCIGAASCTPLRVDIWMAGTFAPSSARLGRSWSPAISWREDAIRQSSPDPPIDVLFQPEESTCEFRAAPAGLTGFFGRAESMRSGRSGSR